MYEKTHGHSEPGEQKVRNYNWPFNKSQHSFGKEQSIEQNGAKKCLENDFLLNLYPQTKVGNKRLEDFRQATANMVGKGKYKGSLPENITSEYVFGVKTIKDGDWNAGKCLSGEDSLRKEGSLKADLDLGRSVRYIQKNKLLIPNENIDLSKQFGVPSVRNDLKEKEFKSLSDYTVSNISKII